MTAIFDTQPFIRYNRRQAWLALLGFEFRIARFHFRRVKKIHRIERQRERQDYVN